MNRFIFWLSSHLSEWNAPINKVMNLIYFVSGKLSLIYSGIVISWYFKGCLWMKSFLGLSRTLGSVAKECFAFQILLKICWLITDWHLSCGSCAPWPFVQDCYRTQRSWIRSELSLLSPWILPVKLFTFS